MERVAIVGPGGAGKTTLARELGARTGLPVVHLDERHWRPGWVETPRDEWAAVVSDLAAGDRWIIEGNYGGTFDQRFGRADTVVVVAPPRVVCVARALGRSLRHYGSAVQAPGCPERVDLGFLRWIWRYRADSRPMLDHALARHADHLTVVEVRTRRGARSLLDSVHAVPPRDGSPRGPA